MKINIHRWVFGTWKVVPTEVTRVTKTMIIVGHGHGAQRFNRRTGWIAGHVGHGMAGMTDPSILHEDLKRFEEELKVEEG